MDGWKWVIKGNFEPFLRVYHAMAMVNGLHTYDLDHILKSWNFAEPNFSNFKLKVNNPKDGRRKQNVIIPLSSLLAETPPNKQVVTTLPNHVVICYCSFNFKLRGSMNNTGLPVPSKTIKTAQKQHCIRTMCSGYALAGYTYTNTQQSRNSLGRK